MKADEAAALGEGAREGASGTPTLWNRTVNAFTPPLVETWGNDPPMECCEALRGFPILWFAANASVFVDTPEKLQG